ncbi:hypothetical protein Taro_044339 [Colocasia esculenta]|uniref:Uncharacterized protein n=1 Tax=Colocasia esculenta TaxID=4460 RepID=A0A843WY32_COLES|nr:hypothetical protein [Colocasia esculenta]
MVRARNPLTITFWACVRRCELPCGFCHTRALRRCCTPSSSTTAAAPRVAEWPTPTTSARPRYSSIVQREIAEAATIPAAAVTKFQDIRKLLMESLVFANCYLLRLENIAEVDWSRVNVSGRTRSLVTLLRLYSTASSMAVALSVACVVQNHSQVIQEWDISSFKGYELVEVGRITLAVLLQIIIIITTIGLVQNMSPKRVS